MAFNPNAIFVSPSSLGDLEKCPQLYYYRNVYRSPRGFKIQITNPSLALGQVVHDIISQFVTIEPPLRTEPELKRITELLWANIHGDKGGFASEEEESEYKSRAEIMLGRFWANEHFHTATGAKIPNFPKVDLGPDLILTGKLDWIEKTDSGGYLIIDFKTGKNREKDDSLQLPIYALLANDIFKTTDLTAQYWYLDLDDKLEDAKLPSIKDALSLVKQKSEIAQMVRKTSSYQCQSGGESCWACKDMVAVIKGQGKLVTVDMNRKQEIYILPKFSPVEEKPVVDDLPF